MHISAYIAAGFAIAAAPLIARDQIDSGLSSLAGTTTVTATVTQVPGSPAPGPADGADPQNEWTGGPEGTGLFAVGAHPRDGLAAIPAGRYEVKVAPGAAGGDWMVCDAALCGPAFEANATVVGHAVAPYSSAMYIVPTATHALDRQCDPLAEQFRNVTNAAGTPFLRHQWAMRPGARSAALPPTATGLPRASVGSGLCAA